jgi:2-phospho-L-lactate guanylyltransferase (CobY/MobA/RfbA family)
LLTLGADPKDPEELLVVPPDEPVPVGPKVLVRILDAETASVVSASRKTPTTTVLTTKRRLAPKARAETCLEARKEIFGLTPNTEAR